jgi:hypothetical protein
MADDDGSCGKFRGRYDEGGRRECGDQAAESDGAA